MTQQIRTSQARDTENNSMEIGNQVWTLKSDKKDQQSKPCIWMASGAVSKKHCNNYFDCTSCKYDSAMEERVAMGKQRSWQDSMRMKESIVHV